MTFTEVRISHLLRMGGIFFTLVIIVVIVLVVYFRNHTDKETEEMEKSIETKFQSIPTMDQLQEIKKKQGELTEEQKQLEQQQEELKLDANAVVDVVNALFNGQDQLMMSQGYLASSQQEAEQRLEQAVTNMETSLMARQDQIVSEQEANLQTFQTTMEAKYDSMENKQATLEAKYTDLERRARGWDRRVYRREYISLGYGDNDRATVAVGAWLPFPAIVRSRGLTYPDKTTINLRPNRRYLVILSLRLLGYNSKTSGVNIKFKDNQGNIIATEARLVFFTADSTLSQAGSGSMSFIHDTAQGGATSIGPYLYYAAQSIVVGPGSSMVVVEL